MLLCPPINLRPSQMDVGSMQSISNIGIHSRMAWKSAVFVFNSALT